MVGRTPAETALQCNCVQIQNVSCLHSLAFTDEPFQAEPSPLDIHPGCANSRRSSRFSTSDAHQTNATGPGYGRTTHRNMATRPTMDLSTANPRSRIEIRQDDLYSERPLPRMHYG